MEALVPPSNQRDKGGEMKLMEQTAPQYQTQRATHRLKKQQHIYLFKNEYIKIRSERHFNLWHSRVLWVLSRVFDTSDPHDSPSRQVLYQSHFTSDQTETQRGKGLVQGIFTTTLPQKQCRSHYPQVELLVVSLAQPSLEKVSLCGFAQRD